VHVANAAAATDPRSDDVTWLSKLLASAAVRVATTERTDAINTALRGAIGRVRAEQKMRSFNWAATEMP